MAKDSFIDRLTGKLDDMDSDSIQAYIFRLCKEKGFLDTVFNTIHEGVVVIDKNLRIRYRNKAASRFLGLPEDYETVRISQFLRDVDWRRLLGEDEEEWYRLSRQEIEVFYPKRRILHFYLVPNESQRGIATIILNDVTESRERAESRVESEKVHVISMLAASVAHEIGNPLNSLYLHLQLLQRQVNSDDDIDRDDLADLLNTAKGEVERLDSIINQFLQAVRPSKPELTMIDLKELLVDSLNFLKAEIENRRINIKCSWPDLLPQISGDANQLKQAFYNIIKNALQAMTEGGEIDIACEYDDDFVELSFSDTGKGIALDEIGEIFDPYYSSKTEGTGLGLMVVERIIRDHGAEMAINSRKTEGTDFIVKFPRYGKRMRLLPTPADTDEPLNVEFD